MKQEPKTFCLFDSWNRACNNGEANCVFTPHFNPDPEIIAELKEIYGDDWKYDEHENPDWDQNQEKFWGGLKSYDKTFSDSLMPYTERGDLAGYLITGQLGLWNGPHKIYPVFIYSLYRAVCKCWTYDELRVDITDGIITCFEYHHDGTNVFQIQGISRKSMTPSQLERLMEGGDGSVIDEDLYDTLFAGKKRHLRKINLLKHLGISEKKLKPPKTLGRPC